MSTRWQLAALAAILAAAISLSARSARAQGDAERPLGQAAPPERVDPTVQHVLDLNPTTPEERVRASLVLVDLGAPKHALPWLEALVAEGLTDEQWGRLRGKLGMHAFLRLARVPELEPAGAQLVQAVSAAAERIAHDPTRIDGYVERLGDASPEVRHAAEVQLQMAGSAAVQPLLNVLRSADDGLQRDSARHALVALERDALAPLVAALASGEPRLEAEVIRALSQMGARHTSVYWLRGAFAAPKELHAAAVQALQDHYGRVPDQREALARLIAAADHELYGAKAEDDLVVNSEMELWSWDMESKAVRSQMLPRELVRALRVERLAADAVAIEPSHEPARRLLLAARLEAAARRAGLDHAPAAVDLAGYDAAALHDLLDHALETDQDAVALQAARQLGRTATAEILLAGAGKPVPLVRALRHPRGRVRFAALEAVMNLEPDQPFPGASWVTETLAYFANGGGARRAIVADPRTEEAQRLGGMLLELGYEVEMANDGASLFHLAADYPDTELLVITPALDRPTAVETLSLLRRDARTARIPTAVVANLTQYERAERIVRGDAWAEALVRPHETSAFSAELAPLLARDRDGLTPVAVRVAQTQQALKWLADLSAAPGWLYDLHSAAPAARRTLHDERMTASAAKFLGHLGTHTDQRALAELASHGSRELAQRQAAVQALRHSLARRGVQLTTEEVIEQYARYNRSEDESAESQAVLGGLLDALEARAMPHVTNPAVEAVLTDQ